MTVYTLFHCGNVQAFDSNAVDDMRFAKEFAIFLQELKFNILKYRAESVILDATETRDYTLFTGFALSDWWVLYAKVVGQARFTLNYDDPLNPLSTITSNISAYGSSNFPGIYTQSLVGLTTNGGSPAIRITGLEDNTKIQFFYGQAAADNNATWIAQK